MASEKLTIVAIRLPDDLPEATLLEFHRSASSDLLAKVTSLPLAPQTLALLSPAQDALVPRCIELFHRFPRARAVATVSEATLVIERAGCSPVFTSDDTMRALELLEHVEEGSFITTGALREHLGVLELQLEEDSVPEVFLELEGKGISLFPSYEAPDVTNLEQMDAWAAQISSAIRRGLTGKSPESLDMLIKNADSILNTASEGAREMPAQVARALCALRLWLNPLWMRPTALEVTRDLLERDVLDARSRVALRELFAAQLKKQRLVDDSIEEHTAILDDPAATPLILGRCFIALSELYFWKQDVERALEYAGRALALGKDHGISSIEALAHQAKAEALIASATAITSELTAEILKEFEKSVATAQASEDLQVQLIALGEWSNFSSIDTPSKSLENLKHVKALATKLRIEHFVSMCSSVMGDIALRIKRPDLAREYLNQTRAQLDEHDKAGQWCARLQEALICLYEQNYDQATRHTTLLEEMSKEYEHWMGQESITRLFMLIALMMEQFERFDLITEGKLFEEKNIDETICMLRDLLTDRQNEEKLSALVERLDWHQQQALHHEWLELVWRTAIAHFPDTFVPVRVPDTLAVHAEQGWFLSREQTSRVEIAHRPYLHRMFKELLAQHESRGKGIDTIELFDACWPGETVSFEVMKNRVYVGISNLRNLGLRPWLVRLPDGYTLADSLDVIHATPTGLE